jgi:16S rRNA (guanine527-N7)-methyltransferase
MPTLTESAIAELLQPYLSSPAAHSDICINASLYAQLSDYLDLLLKWNARTNLTAIRDPEEIVRRHFGESLFLARHLEDTATLLDFGSGAGFPGIPAQLLLPTLCVTLAESQQKKAAFLREVVRTLNLPTQVWAARIESMPPSSQFDAVALRAVDKMHVAVLTAAPRAKHRLLVLGNRPRPGDIAQPLAPDFQPTDIIPLPSSETSALLVGIRS